MFSGKGPSPEKSCVLASAANLSARQWSTGRRNFTSRFSAFSHRGAGDVDLVGFGEGFARGLTLGVEEGVGHGAADEQSVDLVEQGVDDLDLVGDLGAADDGDEGAVGVGDGLAEVGEFLLHEQAGGALAALLLDEVRDAFGGGVGAVCGTEGVVDVDVAELGELFGEGWVVGLFGGVEAQVFEQESLAGLEVAGHLARDGADAVGREGDVLAVGEDVHRAGRGDGRRRGEGSWCRRACPWDGRGARRG